MKIVILAGSNVIHTVRWANSLCERGNVVYLFSMHKSRFALDPRVKCFSLPLPPPVGYYLNVPYLYILLRKIKPDLVNAHYASGYGTLGRLSGYRPYILSVWGSDVYDFPEQSTYCRKLLIRNLRSADTVCSTSNAMARKTRELCPSLDDIAITPFGVDIDRFCPVPESKDDAVITIGTVKCLEQKYGVDTLIRSFAATRNYVLETQPELADRLRLLIVGSGSESTNLKNLVSDLQVKQFVTFAGFVPHGKVPDHLHKMDIYVALSRLDSESFGVAIVEASACGIPVVVSDTDGPREVVRDGVTGLIVPRENIEAASRALVSLVKSNELRNQLGFAGREHVVNSYNWERSVDIMEHVYSQTVALHKERG